MEYCKKDSNMYLIGSLFPQGMAPRKQTGCLVDNNQKLLHLRTTPRVDDEEEIFAQLIMA